MFIISWLRQLFYKEPHKKPGKVRQFNAELIDMSNVRVSWVLPNVTPNQKPIQHTEISVRVANILPWTVQDIVSPDVAQELLFVDTAAGTLFFRAIVVDIDEVRGAGKETSSETPFDVPGTVTTLIAVVE